MKQISLISMIGYPHTTVMVEKLEPAIVTLDFTMFNTYLLHLSAYMHAHTYTKAGPTLCYLHD